jgi:acyl-CoA hydrolase
MIEFKIKFNEYMDNRIEELNQMELGYIQCTAERKALMIERKSLMVKVKNSINNIIDNQIKKETQKFFDFINRDQENKEI